MMATVSGAPAAGGFGQPAVAAGGFGVVPAAAGFGGFGVGSPQQPAAAAPGAAAYGGFAGAGECSLDDFFRAPWRVSW